MKLLEERIKKDGIAVNEDILKVDSFINHQVDPELMQAAGKIRRTFRRTGNHKGCNDREFRNCSRADNRY